MHSDAVSDLLTFVTTDFAGITRGRAMRLADWHPGKSKSMGWVPANMSLTPFDIIADPNPWGSKGDLRLLGDEAARYSVALPGSATPLDLMFSDIVELDGSAWALCPRTLLKSALDDLLSMAGITLNVSFEHEFQVFGTHWDHAPAFSLQALRRADPFGPAIMGALHAAGLQPEMFIAEYGRDQFEVPIAPAPALAAADRAVVLREVVRELARNRGWRASFAPKTMVEGVGNGVHIHFSFEDENGKPATYDPDGPHGMSAGTASFVAGVLKYLDSIVAFTAPSTVSYLRLKPHRWSAAFNNLGFPLYSTLSNWGRSTLGVIPFVSLGASWYGATGALAGSGLGAVLFGLASAYFCFKVIKDLERRNPLEPVAQIPPAGNSPFSSGKAATLG